MCLGFYFIAEAVGASAVLPAFFFVWSRDVMVRKWGFPNLGSPRLATVPCMGAMHLILSRNAVVRPIGVTEVHRPQIVYSHHTIYAQAKIEAKRLRIEH